MVATWEEASKVVTSNNSKVAMVVAVTSSSSSSNRLVDIRKVRVLRDMVAPLRQATTPTPQQPRTVLRGTTRTLRRHGLRRVTDRMANSRLEWIPTHMRRESRGSPDRVA